MEAVHSIILDNYIRLKQLCEGHKVEQLYAFGSVLRSDFDIESSDIDLLVELSEMPPIDRGLTLLSLWDGLEDLFNRKVDLVSESSLENPYFRAEVGATKQLIYDRGRQEIPI